VPPGTVYDVFGTPPEDLPPERQRIVVQGNVYEGWDAIPEDLKAKGPASQGDVTYKQGTTLMTFKF
jgi:hypothetical protein